MQPTPGPGPTRTDECATTLQPKASTCTSSSLTHNAQRLANHFINLKTARETAEYDPNRVLTVYDANCWIGQARSALIALQATSTADRQIFRNITVVKWLRARAILNSAEAHHIIPARPVGTIRSRGRVVRTTDFKAFGVTVHARV